MPVQKAPRSDGARRTTMDNFPDRPKIPLLSSSRVHDVPYIQIPNDHYPEPGKCDRARAMFMKAMEMVDNKRPFKLELKQRYITFRDMDHYWADPDGGNKKQCDILPTCLSCGSEHTVRIQCKMTVCRGKWFVETENMCLDCRKYTQYDFKDPDIRPPVGEQTEPFIGQIHPKAKKYFKEQRIKENKKRIANGEEPIPDPVMLPGGVEMDPETGKFLNNAMLQGERNTIQREANVLREQLAASQHQLAFVDQRRAADIQKSRVEEDEHQRAIAALSENLHALKAADMVRDTAHHYSARMLLEFGRLIQVITQKDEGNTQLQVQLQAAQNECSQQLLGQEGLKAELCGLKQQLHHCEMQLSGAVDAVQQRDMRIAELDEVVGTARQSYQQAVAQIASVQHDTRETLSLLERSQIEAVERARAEAVQEHDAIMVQVRRSLQEELEAMRGLQALCSEQQATIEQLTRQSMEAGEHHHQLVQKVLQDNNTKVEKLQSQLSEAQIGNVLSPSELKPNNHVEALQIDQLRAENEQLQQLNRSAADRVQALTEQNRQLQQALDVENQKLSASNIESAQQNSKMHSAVLGDSKLANQIDVNKDGATDKKEQQQWQHEQGSTASTTAAENRNGEFEAEKERLTQHYQAMEHAFMQKVESPQDISCSVEKDHLSQECNRLQHVYAHTNSTLHEATSNLRTQIIQQEADIRQLTARGDKRSDQLPATQNPTITQNSPAVAMNPAAVHPVIGTAGYNYSTPKASHAVDSWNTQSAAQSTASASAWNTPSTEMAWNTPSAAMAHSSIESAQLHQPTAQIDAMLSQLSSVHVTSATEEAMKWKNRRLDPTLDRLDRAIGRANSDVEQRARNTLAAHSKGIK